MAHDEDVQVIEDMQDIQAGPEYKLSTGSRDREEAVGEVVVMMISSQNQASADYQSCMLVDPGLARDTVQREAPYQGQTGSGALGVSEGPKKFESSEGEMLHGAEGDSSSQAKMCPHDSTAVPLKQMPDNELPEAPLRPQSPRQPLPVNVDPIPTSQTVGETTEGSKCREVVPPHPWSSDQIPAPTPPPPLVQSMDCLPTFTSQRPANLPTTMSRWALSNAWSATDTATPSQR